MHKLICYTAGGLLFLGALSMPSGYYDILRIIIFAASIYLSITNYNNNESGWMIAFCIIALIFNPIIPLYLYDKFTWMVIDIASGITFFMNAKKL